jgi:uncharacterized protein YbjT (DUF2867 family)
MSVLVTGGTGRLGRHLVPLLRADSHDVRVLSRRPGEGHVVGDLADGSGVAAALEGVETVVHAATSGRMKKVDLHGTERLAAAAKSAGVRHLIYVSIVGIDKNPMPYYKIKFAAEKAVRASNVPFTLTRGTQFFELVDGLYRRLHVGSLLFAPAGWRLEPTAPADFAAHLAHRVTGGPTGGVTEFGGPEVWESAALATRVQAAHGRSGRVRSLRVPGRMSGALAAGAQITGPGAEHGTTTLDAWLAARA